MGRPDLVFEGHALQILQGDKRAAVLFADIVSRADVGLIQSGGCLGVVAAGRARNTYNDAFTKGGMITNTKPIPFVADQSFFGHPKGLFFLASHRGLGALFFLRNDGAPCSLHG